MNILVTASTGQLGLELLRLQETMPFAKFTFCTRKELDFEKPELFALFFQGKQFDYIINTAAYTQVDLAEKETDKANVVNGYAVAELAKQASKMNAVLLHVSTDYVFAGNAHQPIDETALPSPCSVYGSSKLLGENLALQAHAKTLIFRTSWVYSSFGKNFVKTMIGLFAQKTELKVVADQIGTPTSAKDLALMLLHVIKHLAENKNFSAWGVYHYSNEGVASWYDFAYYLAGLVHTPCQVLPQKSADYPTPAQRPFYSILDKTKIKHTFALPILHWTESVKHCIEEIKP